MQVLYAATDYIAIPLMEALNEKGLLRAVFTAPDKPGKRGKALLPSPIKARALELGIDVYTPETLKKEARELVKTLNVDTLISFCYGKIFGPMFLALFENTFNVHPSMLPKYRGAAPLYATILNGDREGAISLQKIALGVDEGDIYKTMVFLLDGTETEDSLCAKVGELAPSLVLPVLDDDGRMAREQAGEPSYQMFITKEDGKLDFSRSARELHSQIRACYSWPKAYALIKGERLMITGVYGSAFDSFESTHGETPGTVVSFDKTKGLKVSTGDGYLYITRVLPPMKKEMDACSYLNGNKAIIGSILE